MKKIMLVFSLSLMFILPGCGGGGGSSICTFSGYPTYRRYVVIYPDYYQVSGGTGYDGSIRVASRSYNCYYLSVLVGNNYGYTLTADPSTVNLQNPPASGTITGQGFDATYGMPLLEYFDYYGYLIGSVYATSVSGDGTSLTANIPDLSYVYSGTYQIRVTNKRYDGYYLDIVGFATITATGRDRPDSDGDGWYDDEDCAPYDPFLNYDCSSNCGGNYNLYREICPIQY